MVYRVALALSIWGGTPGGSDFGVELEKRVNTLAQLLFDFLFATLEDMQRNVRIAPVFQLDSAFPNLFDFLCG